MRTAAMLIFLAFGHSHACPPVTGAAPGGEVGLDCEDLKRIVGLLGDEDPAQRDAGTQMFLDAARDSFRKDCVLGLMDELAASPDPEVRGRARDVRRRIADVEEEAGSWDEGIDGMHYREKLLADGEIVVTVEFDGKSEVVRSYDPEVARDAAVKAARSLGVTEDVPRPEFRWYGHPDPEGRRARCLREAGIHVSPETLGWIIHARRVDGAAARAGVNDRDVIVSIDGVRPGTLEDLRSALAGGRRIRLLTARRVLATIGAECVAPVSDPDAVAELGLPERTRPADPATLKRLTMLAGESSPTVDAEITAWLGSVEHRDGAHEALLMSMQDIDLHIAGEARRSEAGGSWDKGWMGCVVLADGRYRIQHFSDTNERRIFAEGRSLKELSAAVEETARLEGISRTIHFSEDGVFEMGTRPFRFKPNLACRLLPAAGIGLTSRSYRTWTSKTQLVAGIVHGGAAWRKGLRPKDVIVSVGEETTSELWTEEALLDPATPIRVLRPVLKSFEVEGKRLR